ncbi:MAG: GntR family transcriptional regulator [Oscillospiraceae bacterium]|nr:GntR family transcriptional regulator [Oscillospiraceae bacterium]
MFDIDLQSRIPIYEQLYTKIAGLAARQILSPGDKIPSVRELAKDLGVNPNTVSKAYLMLERDGLIYSVPGRGTFLAKDLSSVRAGAKEEFGKAVLLAHEKGLERDDLIEVIDGTGVFK